MLDDQIIFIGGLEDNGFKQYASILDAWHGLFSIKFTIDDMPMTNTKDVKALSYGNHMLVMKPGKASAAKYMNHVWTNLKVRYEDGSEYILPAEACDLRLQADLFLLIGGLKADENSAMVVTNSVTQINITSERAQPLKPIESGRALHSCALLGQSILVTGGRSSVEGPVVMDELYDFVTGESMTLGEADSIRRFQHSLIRVADIVFALGGLSTEGPEHTIKQFNATANTWEVSAERLMSTNTSKLIVLPFPMSTVDCVDQCTCGVPPTKARIFHGEPAEVKHNSILS